MKIKFDVDLEKVLTLNEDKADLNKYLVVGISGDQVKMIDRVKGKYKFISDSKITGMSHLINGCGFAAN